MLNNVIYLLTRGYPYLEMYQGLIERNLSIYETLNKYLDNSIPLIIFHEGNILQEHQLFISNNSAGQKLIFIDISNDFQWPTSIQMNSVLELQHFRPSYRMMCKFNAVQVWKYLKSYDYAMRIDEDVRLLKCSLDLFENISKNNLDYATSRWCEETHVLTNTTIPQVAHSIIPEKWKIEDYNQTNLWVPYTNLFIARVGLFLQEEVQSFLNILTSYKEFYTHRWGDHVVSGIVLKAFSSPEKIKVLQNFEYFHGSHSCLTRNGKVISGIISEHEADIFNCKATDTPHYYSQ